MSEFVGKSHWVQSHMFKCSAPQEDAYCPLCVIENVCDQSGNDLVGEVLTFIDAILPEGGQSKAAKDTLKKLLWGAIGNMSTEMRFSIGAGEDL